MGKMKIGQCQLAAVRQMAAHQQMMAKMRLRPVRRPEIAHYIIALLLLAEIKTVHRLPVLMMIKLQHPIITLLQQPILSVWRGLHELGN